MSLQATLRANNSDAGMTRAFIYAVLVHVVIVLFFALNFRLFSQSHNTGESIIKARAVTLPAPEISKPKPKEKIKQPEPKPRAAEKTKPKKAKKIKAKKPDKKRQQEIEKQLQEQLLKEEQEAAAAQAAASKAAKLLDKYRAVIRQKVSRNWIRPAGTGSGKECVVRVRLVAGGEVVNAEVVKSSGDASFDRSVESAVYKAAPLPVPDDPEMFDYFRDIEFLFRPED